MTSKKNLYFFIILFPLLHYQKCVDREGKLVCIVEEENKYQGASAHHLIVKGVSFTVSNKEEAEKIAEIVLNRAQNFTPQHKITGLHFGGTVVFVSMD